MMLVRFVVICAPESLFISEKPNIESLLRCLNHVPFPKQQDTVVDIIDSLMGDFTVYNDEGFYGNGLELGHLLFLANHKSVK